AIVIGVGIVAGTAYFFMRQSAPAQVVIQNYPSPGSNIIAFGDSLVKGIGSTPGNDFVSRISRELDIPIVNKGVSGNTTTDGLKRIDEVLENDPKLVLILFGGNDVLQKIPAETTFRNLETMIQKIHEKDAIVVLLGIPSGLFFRDPYEPQYRALAEKYNTAYVPNILAGLLGHQEYMSDTVHPNDAGYEKMAQLISPVVNKLTK
nr:hypothetical protein [Patescibacteria group bacterium]